MLRVVGIEHKQGTFEGKVYDNYNIHCLSNESKSCIAGETCETVKIKCSEVSSIFGTVMTEADVIALVGLCISPLYDRFKRVIRCEIVDESESMKGGGL